MIILQDNEFLEDYIGSGDKLKPQLFPLLVLWWLVRDLTLKNLSS